MTRRGGFTLIELVVVLAVLVVASGFVIIRMTGWSSKQALQTSARSLGNAVRLWRERARTEEMTYVLELDEHSYKISSGKDVLRQGTLRTGESIEGGKPTSLRLSPRGVLPE